MVEPPVRQVQMFSIDFCLLPAEGVETVGTIVILERKGVKLQGPSKFAHRANSHVRGVEPAVGYLYCKVAIY